MARSEQTGVNSPAGAVRAWSRRSFVGIAGLGLTMAGLGGRSAVGQEGTPASTPTIQHTGNGDMPTTGGARPGPVSDHPPAQESTASRPVSIIVDAAGIDAVIEVRDIAGGRMQDPTGPWVVAWYQQSSALGEIGNALFAGHVDYWGVGPSVFYHVRDLVEGDLVSLTGEDGQVFTYAVVWNETVAIDELISGRMADIVAPGEGQVITLFTCGGEFDYVNGEYLSRTVVRAERVRPELESTPEA